MKIIFNPITRHLEVALYDTESDTTTIEEHFFEDLDEWYFPKTTKHDVRIHFHYEDCAQLLVYEKTVDSDLQLLESWNSPERFAFKGAENLKIVFTDNQREVLEEWFNNHNILIKSPENLSENGLHFIAIGFGICRYIADKYLSEYEPKFNHFDFYVWDENKESINDMFINLWGYEEFTEVSKEQAIKLGWKGV